MLKEEPPKSPVPQLWPFCSPQILCGHTPTPTTALGSFIF